MTKKNYEYYYKKGLEKFNIENYDVSIKSFDRAIRLNPEHADSYFYIARAKYRKDKKEEAIQDFTDAIKLKANPLGEIYIDAYINRSGVYNELNKHTEAFADSDLVIRSLEKKPITNSKLVYSYADAYNIRGLANNGLERYDEAIEDFKSAIKILNPKDMLNPMDKNNMKLAEYYNNKAITYSRKTKILDKKNKLLFFEKFTCSKYKNLDESINNFKKAIDILDNFDNKKETKNKQFMAKIYNNIGIAETIKRNYKNAINNFKESIILDSNFCEPYEHLNNIYESNALALKDIKFKRCIAIVFIVLILLYDINTIYHWRLFDFKITNSLVSLDQRIYLIFAILILYIFPYLLPFIKEIGNVKIDINNISYFDPKQIK